MATKYIIDNLAEQTISGSLSAITLSADTFYGDGSNLTGVSGGSFTGGTVSGETIFDGGLSATTLSATTIDLCTSNGTLYTDSISGCSPINILSPTNFTEPISANTIYISGNPITQPYKKFVGLLTSSPQTLTNGTLIVGETYKILTYNSIIDTLTINNPGTNYSAPGIDIPVSGGSGSGLTVDYTVDGFGQIDNVNINQPGDGYLTGDVCIIDSESVDATIIIDSVIGDDFSNVAEVISGTINQNGCVFRCIDEYPNDWSYSSELQSYGVPLESNGTLNILENSLGVNLSFSSSTVGTYTTMTDGLLFSGKTYWSIGETNWSNLGNVGNTTIINEPSSELSVLTFKETGVGAIGLSNGLLNNTPIEIRVYN